MIISTMGARLAFLRDPQLQRQEVALALEVLAPLDDDALHRACIEATRKAGTGFVMAQHIYAAGEPEIKHRREMDRLKLADERRKASAKLEPPTRLSADRAEEIMQESGFRPKRFGDSQ